MGTVYSTLGARLDVVEMQDGLMQGADRDLVKVWQKMNAPRFDHILLKTKTIAARATDAGIEVSFEGEGAPPPQTYDLVLQAVGRSPNGKKIGAENAGVAVTERGFIDVNAQMRTNVAHIFAIGDIVSQPMLAHKAVHEAHIAAEVIAGEIKGDEKLARSVFDARVIPSVAYTDPEVAWVGLTEEQARAQGVKVKKGLFPWSASGRAIANGRDEGFTKLLFDESSHQIVGGGIVGTHAGDMIGEIALAIEMGADAIDIGKTIHPPPHPGRKRGHGRRSRPRQLHRPAPEAQINPAPARRIRGGQCTFSPHTHDGQHPAGKRPAAPLSGLLSPNPKHPQTRSIPRKAAFRQATYPQISPELIAPVAASTGAAACVPNKQAKTGKQMQAVQTVARSTDIPAT